MNRTFIALGSVCAGLAVIAGAFGAHFLKGLLTSEQLTNFETAVRYQMYHALALLIVGQMSDASRRTLDKAGWCFVAGIVLFSGSLYLIAFTRLRWFGVITPLGGLAFIAGWVVLGWKAWRR